VNVVIEPVNRYEIDFLNSVEETASFLDRHGLRGIGLMPDLFHMNIEDADPAAALRRHARRVEYVHFADSNRNAPGSGHMDFVSPLRALGDSGFKGWIALEIFPRPDPDTAARKGAEYMKLLFAECYASTFLGMEHVGIAAKDSASLAAWYSKTLGWKEMFRTEDDPPIIFMRQGDASLIEIFPDPARGSASSATGAGKIKEGSLHLCIAVADFDAALSSLDASGVEWIAPEKTIFAGGRVRFFADAEGNKLHIVHRPVRVWKG
jgi:catechol 2,3-dioxygenase-like lactoylglutathione lyase family enzyme